MSKLSEFYKETISKLEYIKVYFLFLLACPIVYIEECVKILGFSTTAADVEINGEEFLSNAGKIAMDWMGKGQRPIDTDPELEKARETVKNLNLECEVFPLNYKRASLAGIYEKDLEEKFMRPAEKFAVAADGTWRLEFRLLQTSALMINSLCHLMNVFIRKKELSGDTNKLVDAGVAMKMQEQKDLLQQKIESLMLLAEAAEKSAIKIAPRIAMPAGTKISADVVESAVVKCEEVVLALNKLSSGLSKVVIAVPDIKAQLELLVGQFRSVMVGDTKEKEKNAKNLQKELTAFSPLFAGLMNEGVASIASSETKIGKNTTELTAAVKEMRVLAGLPPVQAAIPLNVASSATAAAVAPKAVTAPAAVTGAVAIGAAPKPQTASASATQFFSSVASASSVPSPLSLASPLTQASASSATKSSTIQLGDLKSQSANAPQPS